MVPTNLLGTYASALHMTQGFLFFDLRDLTRLPALNELWGFFPSIFFPLLQSWSLILHTCSLIMQSITQTIPMQTSGSLYPCNFLFSGTLPCKFRQPQSPWILSSVSSNSVRPLWSAHVPSPYAKIQKCLQLKLQDYHKVYLIRFSSPKGHSPVLPVF